jgi:DNA-binding transcriptional LysR family regulator
MTLEQATLRQLRIFEAAARQGHLGRAATELNLTQPAVSIQLRRLEECVGAELFARAGRGKRLTDVGAALLVQARAILDRLREADEAIGALSSTGGGELRVAATTTAEYFVPRLLAGFRKQHPQLRIRLLVENRETVIRTLAEGLADLAIMGRPPQAMTTSATPFAPHPLAFIAAPDHPLARRRRLVVADLAGETFLLREQGSGTRLAMEQLFTESAFAPAEMVEFGSNETIKQAVVAGMGIGFVSLHTVGLERATRRLAVLRVEGTPVMRRWFVIHRHAQRLPHAAEGFRDYLVATGAREIETAIGR